MHEDPEEEAPKLSVYPSSDFLVNAKPYLLSRYANFLLQSILMLARVYQVPKHLNVKYGLGCSTSTRLALLMMRTRPRECCCSSINKSHETLVCEGHPRVGRQGSDPSNSSSRVDGRPHEQFAGASRRFLEGACCSQDPGR